MRSHLHYGGRAFEMPMRRRRLALFSFLVLLSSALAGVSSATNPRDQSKRKRPYFVGNFERCDFSQWQTQGPSRSFTIIRAGAAEGKCAGALTVGAWALNGLVNARSDGAALYLRPAPYGRVGKTVWQHFSVKFAPGFRSTEGVWNWFGEWHNDRGYERFVGSRLKAEFPNLCWTIRTKNGRARLAMRIIGGDSTAPTMRWVNGPRLRIEHWYDFRVRAVWSPSAKVGRVDWWLDGKRLFSRHLSTLYTRPDGTVSSVHFVLDHYRLHANWESTILFDGVRLGPTISSVRY
jgi:hypothetical protein